MHLFVQKTLLKGNMSRKCRAVLSEIPKFLNSPVSKFSAKISLNSLTPHIVYLFTRLRYKSQTLQIPLHLHRSFTNPDIDHTTVVLSRFF